MAETVEDTLRRASALRQAGRFAEAEAAYTAVLERAPGHATSWYNLGYVQRRQNKLEAALASYQRALESGVSEPEEAHLNRAAILAEPPAHREAAQRELEAALAINPNYAPALFNLAGLHEQAGDRDAAAAAYDRLLELDPSNNSARARRADMHKASSEDDAVLLDVRDALRKPGLDDAESASLGFAYGRLLDQIGAYDEAFAAYQAANHASRRSASSDPPLYDRAAHTAFIDQLIEAFAQPAGGSPQDQGGPPIFICGMFRSGSTLVEQVLAGHERVFAGGELPFIPSLVRELRPYPKAAAQLDERAARTLAERYERIIAPRLGAAQRLTDKRPDNYLHIGLIKRLWPTAKIVHTVRDPLDTCLSIYFLHLDHGMGYALDLADIAHHYREHRRLMAHWRTRFGADIIEFDYDAFVQAPESHARRLLEALGLEWRSACLDLHLRNNLVNTASIWQVREAIHPGSSGRWRNYERHLAPLMQALRDT